jgi:hypothetical protein
MQNVMRRIIKGSGHVWVNRPCIRVGNTYQILHKSTYSVGQFILAM